jgi:hypothetical protein
MSFPGYGPNGFKINPSGLHSWETQKPPILQPDVASYIPAIGLGYGALPRYSLREVDEALRVKEA